VATIGLKNVTIIETDDAILVCDMDKTQDVKKVVEHLKNTNASEYL
jgi:mannose-1-phosphate guanylyltransferase